MNDAISVEEVDRRKRQKKNVRVNYSLSATVSIHQSLAVTDCREFHAQRCLFFLLERFDFNNSSGVAALASTCFRMCDQFGSNIPDVACVSFRFFFVLAFSSSVDATAAPGEEGALVSLPPSIFLRFYAPSAGYARMTERKSR